MNVMKAKICEKPRPSGRERRAMMGVDMGIGRECGWWRAMMGVKMVGLGVDAGDFYG